MTTAYDVRGKTVFITGAARGIGAATARRLHARGASVVLVGLEPDALFALERELGSNALATEADVTDAAAMKRAAALAVERFGGIDVVVANAGVLHVGSVADSLEHQFERTLSVNLLGAWRTLRATLPHVIERRGYVLTVASLAALGHGPLMGAYAASKAAVEAMTDSLRIELATKGVGVGCAYFGAVDTDLVHGSRKHPAMRAVEAMAPKFGRREIPLEDAIDVIESGIRHRSARVWAPFWVGPWILLRGVMQPMIELFARTRGGVAEALELARPDRGGARAQDDLLGAAANVARSGKSPSTRTPLAKQ